MVLVEKRWKFGHPDWHEPASAPETMAAHMKLYEMAERGCRFSSLETDTGVPAEAIRWMARSVPFMPYSKDFCRAVVEARRDLQRASKRRGCVMTDDLTPRVKRLYDYGYSYAEMSQGRGFTRDVLGLIARGSYPYTDQARHDEIARMCDMFENRMRRDVAKTMRENSI